MKKYAALILMIFCFYQVMAQEKKILYVKTNAIFLPVGMLNVGVEYQLNNRYTAQADVFISPWKSFAGKHLQVYMGHLEGRYYFDKAFEAWYLGANVGLGVFDIQKYNYAGTNFFQRGFNVMAGATVGYQLKWKERWNVDLYLGAGTSQAFYHGYDIESGVILRNDRANKWNKSGEFLPYRGGVMIAYKLR